MFFHNQLSALQHLRPCATLEPGKPGTRAWGGAELWDRNDIWTAEMSPENQASKLQQVENTKRQLPGARMQIPLLCVRVSGGMVKIREDISGFQGRRSNFVGLAACPEHGPGISHMHVDGQGSCQLAQGFPVIVTLLESAARPPTPPSGMTGQLPWTSLHEHLALLLCAGIHEWQQRLQL